MIIIIIIIIIIILLILIHAMIFVSCILVVRAYCRPSLKSCIKLGLEQIYNRMGKTLLLASVTLCAREHYTHKNCIILSAGSAPTFSCKSFKDENITWKHFFLLRSWESLGNRPSFYTYSHRGKVLFQNNEVSWPGELGFQPVKTLFKFWILTKDGCEELHVQLFLE